MRQAATWAWELHYLSLGKKTVVGLDEVGRGCLAGPLVSVAYSFTIPFPTDLKIYDSKQLSALQRQKLATLLVGLGAAGLGQATALEIDELGLQQAQYLSYSRALLNLKQTPDIVLLDGRMWSDCPYPIEAIVKGDSRVASIGAASIMAKVYRDNLMQTTVHTLYPKYGFQTHVGYGTASHMKALDTFGPCPEHRKTFQPVQHYFR